MLMSQTLLIFLLSQWLFMTCPFRVELRRKYSGKAHLIILCPKYGRDMLAF